MHKSCKITSSANRNFQSGKILDKWKKKQKQKNINTLICCDYKDTFLWTWTFESNMCNGLFSESKLICVLVICLKFKLVHFHYNVHLKNCCWSKCAHSHWNVCKWNQQREWKEHESSDKQVKGWLQLLTWWSACLRRGADWPLLWLRSVSVCCTCCDHVELFNHRNSFWLWWSF